MTSVKSNPTQGLVKLNEALDLSPLNISGLEELYDYHRYNEPNSTIEAAVLDKLQLVRTIEDWYTIDDTNMDFGEVVRLWHREDIPLVWDSWETDISEFVSESGCYDFSYYYTKGWDALQIESAALVFICSDKSTFPSS